MCGDATPLKREPLKGPPSSGGLSRSTAELPHCGWRESFHRKYCYIKFTHPHTLHRLKTQPWNSDTAAKSQEGTTCLTAGVRPLINCFIPKCNMAEIGAKHTSIVGNAPKLSRKSWRSKTHLITRRTHVSNMHQQVMVLKLYVVSTALRVVLQITA